MFKVKIYKISTCFCLIFATAAIHAANFTYDGVNRRDPLTPVEQRTVEATGGIYCVSPVTNQLMATTGFLIDLGQESGNPILLTSGHSFREVSNNVYRTDCNYKPYATDINIPLVNNVAGDLVQRNPAVYIKNDWGVSIVPASTNYSSRAIAVSQRSYRELQELLRAGLAEVKFYGGNLNPDQGEARIQISDNCSIWEPVPGAILGAGHSIYTNCDSTGSSSGGPLVIELYDGTVEAIGIMFGAIHTVDTVNIILGENASSMTIKDVEHAISFIPSPDTIINIAVPLIPDMREQGLSELLDDLSAI